MLTQELVKDLLDYNPSTGAFTWANIPPTCIKTGDSAGSLGSNGYIKIQIKGRCYLAHRVAWLYVHGYMPDGHIDHINHLRDDNRIDNLRGVTIAENARNRASTKASRSGVMGVYCAETSGKWRARIWRNGGNVDLGTFSSKEDAIKARKAAEKKYGYHENHGK